MKHRRFLNDERGSAVRWFAYAAAALTVLSMAGAQGLARLADAGRLPTIAFHGPPTSTRDVEAPGVDLTPTGSVSSLRASRLR